MSDPFCIADRCFQSRLILGTSRYPDDETRKLALETSGAELITVAIRRLQLDKSAISIISSQESTERGAAAIENRDEGIASVISEERFSIDALRSRPIPDEIMKIADKSHPLSSLPSHLALLPNTAGCFTAKEAVLVAELAREALQTHWIKLEVIGDEKTLFPDTAELLKAARELVQKGFVVLPYCTDDLIVCRRLVEMGCAAVMPLGSPIGSGMGILNPYNLRILREQIELPILIDAGIGTASDVAMAMELGIDGVMTGTAIAQAKDPVAMALAMKLACQAGRLAYRAGRIPRSLHAHASSPTTNRMVLP